jgi:hypothetical protein
MAVPNVSQSSEPIKAKSGDGRSLLHACEFHESFVVILPLLLNAADPPAG